MELVNGTQLDLLDLLSVLAREQTAKISNIHRAAKSVVDDTDAGDYLTRGERIETLARQRFARTLHAMSVSDLEQRLYAVAYDSGVNFYRHIGKLAAVMRRFIQGMAYTEEDEKYRCLKDIIDFDFEIRDVDPDVSSCIHAFKRLKYKMKKSASQVVLTIKEDGWDPLYIYGYKSENAGKTSYLMVDSTVVADTGLVLAWLFVLTQYNRALSDEDMRGPLSEAFSGWFANCVSESYYPVWNTVSSISLRAIGTLKDTEGRNLNYKDCLSAPCMRTRYALPFKEYERPREEVVDLFRSFFGLGDADIPVSSQNNRAVKERNSETYRTSRGTQYHMFLLDSDLEYAFACTDPMSFFDKGFGRISYNSILPRATHIDSFEENVIPRAWGLPTYTSISRAKESLLCTVIQTVWEEKGQLVKKLRYYKEMEPGKSVAKSYQTKKGIPQKVLKEMEDSDFNRYFGYVEIDEGCDLEKVRAISDEFSAFKEEFMPGFDSTGVALRFRRLGNHKALGIYYPMLGCLCVDITSPSSFIHEYGHCLDHVCGKGRKALSDGEDFFHVYTLYRNALLKGMSKDEAVAKRLAGCTKYNLDYYLLHTESFARCFELYVANVLKVDTSLCKQEKDLGFAYPADEELLESIRKYFDALLVTVNSAKAEEELTAA